jgi:hypothetical protein
VGQQVVQPAGQQPAPAVPPCIAQWDGSADSDGGEDADMNAPGAGGGGQLPPAQEAPPADPAVHAALVAQTTATEHHAVVQLVRKALDAWGWNQTRFAEEADTSSCNLSLYMHGKLPQGASATMRGRIAEVLAKFANRPPPPMAIGKGGRPRKTEAEKAAQRQAKEAKARARAAASEAKEAANGGRRLRQVPDRLGMCGASYMDDDDGSVGDDGWVISTRAGNSYGLAAGSADAAAAAVGKRRLSTVVFRLVHDFFEREEVLGASAINACLPAAEDYADDADGGLVLLANAGETPVDVATRMQVGRCPVRCPAALSPVGFATAVVYQRRRRRRHCRRRRVLSPARRLTVLLLASTAPAPFFRAPRLSSPTPD